MNKYKGLDVTHGKTPDPGQYQHNKLLFSSTQTLPYMGTFTLPSAQEEMQCSISLCISLWQSILLLKWQEMFSDIQSHSETVVSYHIYKEEDIAALKKALRYSQILPTVSFLMILLCSHDLDILYEMLKF